MAVGGGGEGRRHGSACLIVETEKGQPVSEDDEGIETDGLSASNDHSERGRSSIQKGERHVSTCSSLLPGESRHSLRCLSADSATHFRGDAVHSFALDHRRHGTVEWTGHDLALLLLCISYLFIYLFL